MLLDIWTYRRYYISGLLIFYLIGLFHLPLVEGIHFLSHIGDDVPNHSIQSHNIQHQHGLLTQVVDVLENNKESNNSSEDFLQQVDLLKQIIAKNYNEELTRIDNTSQLPNFINSNKVVFLDKVFPPPKWS